MNDGAWEGLPQPPFDYEQEPLVTCTGKLNTIHLRKTVRWLVDCVKDQQQTLVRHGQRLDSQQAVAQDDEGCTAPEQGHSVPRCSLSDGFSATLQGELLDMKISALNRSLKAELPRMSDFDSERARMLADVAALQRELSSSFQEADKRIHSELATTTGKLFEQLNRISTDVLARIEDLESSMRTLQECQPQTSAVSIRRETTSSQRIPTSPSAISASAKQCEDPSEPSSLSRQLNGNLPISSRPTSADGDVHTARSVEVQPPSTGNMEPLFPGLGSILPPESYVGSISRPGTTGTVGFESIEGDGSIASTADCRKSTGKDISSWTEVQETLGMIANTQRQALEDARKELADMSDALQKERDDRLTIQAGLEALQKAQCDAEGSFNDLRREFAAVRSGQFDVKKLGTALHDDMHAFHDRATAATPTSPMTTSEQHLVETVGSEREQHAATSGAGLLDFVNGAVDKVSQGQKSGGMRSHSKEEVRQAAVHEAKGWLNQDGAVPGGSLGSDLHLVMPQAAGRSQAGTQPSANAEVTKQALVDGIAAQSPDALANDARAAALGESIKELRNLLPASKDQLSSSACAITAAATPEDLRASTGGFESRLFELEERLGVIEGRPVSKIEGRLKPAGTALDQDAAVSSKHGDLVSGKSAVNTAPSPDSVDSGPAAVFDHGLSSPATGSNVQDFKQIQDTVNEMVRASEEAMRDNVAGIAGDVQILRDELQHFAGRTNEMLSKLSNGGQTAAAAAHVDRPFTSPSMLAGELSSSPSPAAGSRSMVQASGSSRPSSGRVFAEGSGVHLPSVQDQFDAALDKHPADLSHLLDPQNSGGQTPLAFVSRRGLQHAVEGLTDNFRTWLDAIYQSIILALQNKADSSQVQHIAEQVHLAADHASESVASFAKRALGGRCASCDNPLTDESLMWRRPPPGGPAPGSWIPKASRGAQHSIRPPVCGASKLPDLRNIRQRGDCELRISRDFPKGKVLKGSASDPQMRLLRQADGN
jgi:hypothetical protein